ACRRYLYGGNCVPACPTRRIYNVHTSSWEQNKEGRFSLGHVCVSQCPEGFLMDGDHCVLKCSRPGTQQIRNQCVQCPPSGCLKSCSAKQLQLPSVDFLYKSLLKQMVNCTFWEGSLILKKQSFEGDTFHNLTQEEESVTFEDLKNGLGNIQEITGILYIGTESLAPWLRNLTFLSKLRRIGGEAPQGYNSPLKILHNYYLEHLGISSLKLVGAHRGVIQIVQNPKLCLAETIKWRSLMWMPERPTTDMTLSFPIIFQNRPSNECLADRIGCDESVCDLQHGCWGPGPTNCRVCAHWLIQGREETGRCVLNCSLVEGGYYPVVITRTIRANKTLKANYCYKCHKECGTAPGACFGPDANHCNNGCANVLDGEFCRAECPLGKFPDGKNVCQECASVCTTHPQGLYDETESTNWTAVCTGPGDWFGSNGCSHCVQVVSANSLVKESALKLKCLTPYQHCPNDTFLHLINIPRDEPEEELRAKIREDNSLIHFQKGLHSLLGDWLTAHQLQRSKIGMVRICAPCHSQCSNGCSGPSPNQCTQCRNARYNGICVEKCVEGTYETNGTHGEILCLPCHAQCGLGCGGPTASDCDVCRNYKRFLNDNKSKWICVESCPPGISFRIEPNPNTNAVEFVCVYDKNLNNSQPADREKVDRCFLCFSSEIISPGLLNRLSLLSKALFAFCGLSALFIAIYFSYTCSKVVVGGRNLKSNLVMSESASGCNAMCYRFWMKSVIVPDADEEKYGTRNSNARRNIRLRSLPIRSSTLKHGEETHSLMKHQSDTMPDMTTLLIIPEYQLKLGSRVGGGAFGSVFKGIWYKGPISPSFAKEIDNMFAKAIREETSFVPLDSLVEDNTYASTEQEYLTVEEEDEKVIKWAPNIDHSILPEHQTTLDPQLINNGAGDPQSNPIVQLKESKESVIMRPDSLTTEPRHCVKHNEEDSERDDRCVENVEEHVVAIKVLNDETDSSTSKALLEEARASVQTILFNKLLCLQFTDSLIKITDFGLAKCIEDTGGEYTAKGGLMPVKWLAIECIKKRIFSSKSDVWAYGWLEDPEARPSFEDLFQRICYMQLEPQAYLNFRQRGRSRLWSDSGITASSSGYIATTLNTAMTNTENTSIIMKSLSEASEPNTTAASPNYQEREGVEEEGEVIHYASPLSDYRYGIMAAVTSSQRLEQTQLLESIVEDAEETNAFPNDYERPNATFRITDELQAGGASTIPIAEEDYLEPRHNSENTDKYLNF
ncbi:unnamed protein product, partial [Rodentolepis nana]|uniref:Protein kinase domain-containing protein n=1 Tax=Rodentolepis nana TaxID=102285 RepID=A0A158QH81_RODNA